MIRYLLDRDVMSQLDLPEARRPENVKSGFMAIPDDALHVSAITIMEAWRGFALVGRRAAGSPVKLAQCDAYENAFARLTETVAGRIVVVDEQGAKLWGELRGRLDRHHWDLAIAATAVVHDMVVATRNIADFEGRGARVVDPLHHSPAIKG